MDHALAVRGCERVGNLGGDGQRLLERQRPLPEALGERLAREALHYKIRRAVGLAHVEERADVGMAQARDRLRLALEARPAILIGTDIRREDLDGNGSVEAGVAGLVHLAHAAGANGEEDFVRAETGAGRKGHDEPGGL